MNRRLAIIPIVLAAAGCAVTSIDGQRLAVRSDAFAAYVEEVFRRQNEVAVDVGDLLDREADGGAGFERLERLERLEADLLDACRGLNELAEARRAGVPTRGLGAMKRARQAPECEAATVAVETALSRPD